MTRSEKLVASGPNPVVLATPKVATSSPDEPLTTYYTDCRVMTRCCNRQDNHSGQNKHYIVDNVSEEMDSPLSRPSSGVEPGKRCKHL